MAWESQRRKQQLRADPDWEQLRRYVLDRDNHHCTWRLDDGELCGAPANQVDHINGPLNHPANLRSLCEHHHDRRTARQGAEARWAKHTTRRPPEPHPGYR